MITYLLMNIMKKKFKYFKKYIKENTNGKFDFLVEIAYYIEQFIEKVEIKMNEIMNDYLLRMFDEFKKAYGIDDKFSDFNKNQDLFAEWVIAKRAASRNYAQLFDYMDNYDERQTHTMAEFGKGVYDTMAIGMAETTLHKPVIISPYADTFKTISGIEIFKGQLVRLSNNDVVVKYENESDFSRNPNCHPAFNSEIITFMTQIPFSTNDLEPFLALLDSYNTLFIGTFGASTDKDKDDNLQRIRVLYDELLDISYKDVKYCAETQNGSYLSAIKINAKEKVLVKKLTLHR